jgi:hypothetical protein
VKLLLSESGHEPGTQPYLRRGSQGTTFFFTVPLPATVSSKVLEDWYPLNLDCLPIKG